MNGGNDARADGRGRVYQASGDQHIIEHHHHGSEGGAGGPGGGGVWSGLDSVRWPSVGRAPAVLRDRTTLMARLRASVAPDAGGQVYVLHGLGGCGKTAVAYALFQYATSEAGRIGLWVNASDTASLRTGMLAVAADRGAGDGELTAARSGLRAAADLVWDHLDRSDRPWLLVLDNADDPAVLRDGGWLRTSPRGTVLVTTRQAARHWWPGAELLQVGVLPKADAARVLCDLAPAAGTVEEAEAVAERLGRLPLALTLAGGFLAHQVIDPWTMAEYGRNLDGGHGADPIDLLDQGAVSAGADSRHLVSSTWQFSLNALVAQGLPESVTLLRLLACWAGDPLPLSLLSGVEMGDALPRRRVEVALRGLLDQSLTEVVPGTVRCLRTHGVLLDSVWRGTSADQRDSLAATAAGQLLSVLPEVPERGRPDPRTSLLAPHAVALLRRVVEGPDVGRPTVDSIAESLLRLVVALHRAGDYAPALTVAEKAVELGTQQLGADHPSILRLRERVGRSLCRLGRFEESEAVHRQVLADCERVQGPAAPDTLTCSLGLARPVNVLGRREEAVALARRAVAGRTTTLGPVHPLTLIARSHLLSVHPEPEAGAEFMADCQRELGPEHPISVGGALDHAFALFSLQRTSEALPAAREALRLFETKFGVDYPITLNAGALLSQVLEALGKHAEALGQAEAVVEGRMRVLGPEHPWTVTAQERLARFRGA
ncbi:tetratricopeptide repeat protein [Streptomyces ochraceiscleroticus]|uniref:Tetratricopeptide repeat protein n=1 Tax=Streptomyces ochraceiscleroticus TaxID=47761 RepID=A0ABW1MNB2_9ACTN|nr:tetratricopeptide repeat protein [Streptomyces ochraceiscleroticus]